MLDQQQIDAMKKVMANLGKVDKNQLDIKDNVIQINIKILLVIYFIF